MRRSRHSLILCLLCFITAFPALFLPAFCQNPSADRDKVFLFDALAFRGETDSLQRVDIYTVVPYQHLQFVKQGDVYVAKYTLTITVRDTANRKVQDIHKDHSIVQEKYEITEGATAQFDYAQNRVYLPGGTYTIEVQLFDDLVKTESSRSRKIIIANFAKTSFSMSNIMLASAIAQKGDRFSVTPHVTDDVTMLIQEDLFAFFESYNMRHTTDSADFLYELRDGKSDTISRSGRVRRSVKNEREQHFLRIDLPKAINPGLYTLRILALRPDSSVKYTQNDVLATTERSLRVEPRIGYGPTADEDMTKAIRQLRYAATQAEIDNIESAPTLEVKRERFTEFWKKLDPTPNTLRNEAYEEYYRRIEYANKTFRSYTEGWLSDMGMVYIIFGPPLNVDRQSYRSDGRTIEIWSYPNNLSITFVDYSGFGDFRLASPLNSNEKYHYTR